MPLTPGYGETPLPHDALTALLPEVIDMLDKPVTRAAVYDLQQGLQDQVFDELMPAADDRPRHLLGLGRDHSCDRSSEKFAARCGNGSRSVRCSTSSGSSS